MATATPNSAQQSVPRSVKRRCAECRAEEEREVLMEDPGAGKFLRYFTVCRCGRRQNVNFRRG